jgi:hypothetical protein
MLCFVVLVGLLERMGEGDEGRKWEEMVNMGVWAVFVGRRESDKCSGRWKGMGNGKIYDGTKTYKVVLLPCPS